MSEPETLGDLVFRLRAQAGGRSDLVSVSWTRDHSGDKPEGAGDEEPDERRESLSTSDFVRNVHSLAVALDDRGVRRGERVAIYSENRPEWHVTDFACQLLGVATVPIHAEFTTEQVAFVLRNSGSRWVFYSDASKRDRLLQLRHAVTDLPVAIAFDAEARLPDDTAKEYSNAPSFTRLLGEGAERLSDVPLERFRGRTEADDLASVLYTSGTTGDPKGVMLSHRNFLSNVRGCAEVFEIGEGDLAISFLPLSHVFQRTVDLLCFYRGVSIHYVPRTHDVPRALRRRRPTLMAAAPAVYERAWKRTFELLEQKGPLQRKLFQWALQAGQRYASASRDGFVGPLLALQRALADRFVFRDVQQRFGGRLRFAISGGAALPVEVSDFFDAVGIPLYQGYGLTETSPVLATNHPKGQRPGSVGRALSDVELRIEEDGEILVRGPGVMKGYWQDSAATAASINESGWFRTGDVGRVDRSGYLFVTDRKRDLIVTSNGDNVAPRPIETLLAASELFEQAVVLGDGKPMVGALLVPNLERLASVAADADGKADELVPPGLFAHPDVRRAVQEQIDAVNERLAEPSRIGAWTLLAEPFRVEDGTLTPTQKVRRKEIRRRYAGEIEAMYREASQGTSGAAGTMGE